MLDYLRDQVIEQSHLAWREFTKGNPEPVKECPGHHQTPLRIFTRAHFDIGLRHFYEDNASDLF